MMHRRAYGVKIHDLIAKKRDGEPLAAAEIDYAVEEYVKGGIADSQMAALLMAVVIRGMTLRETVALTRAMTESGRLFDFSGLPGPAVDKHSTGGVGDKISLVLLPAAVSCGLHVPMISGRALGFTGGTLDKLESIPGFMTDLSPDRFERLVGELGGCFSAQTEEIVPADRKIYALRDATATVESVPLITASILSKKIAEGARGVVMDVKCGRGAFMQSLEQARGLAEALEAVGREIGFGVRTILTSMEETLGAAVGNALEVEEAVSVLRGEGPRDIAALTHRLVAEMLVLGGLEEGIEEGIRRAEETISSGRALERFMRIVEAQGGCLDLDDDALGLERAPVRRIVPSPRSGYVAGIDPRHVGDAIREMGGGRLDPGDAIDRRVGFVMLRKKGDRTERGEGIFEVHAPNDVAAERAARRVLDTLELSDTPVAPVDIFLD